MSIVGKIISAPKTVGTWFAKRTVPSYANFTSRLEELGQIAKQIRDPKCNSQNTANLLDRLFEERDSLYQDYKNTPNAIKLLGNIIINNKEDEDLRQQAIVVFSMYGHRVCHLIIFLDLVRDEEDVSESLRKTAGTAKSTILHDWERFERIKDYLTSKSSD